MFSKKWTAALLAAVFFCMGIPSSLLAQEKTESKEAAGKSALILCGKDYFNNWLKYKFKGTGLKLAQYSELIKGKSWKENGQKLPPLAELKKYDIVFVFGASLTAIAKDDFLAYLKEGGAIYMTYTTMTQLKEKTGEIAFGVGGFDGYEPIHHKPYSVTKPVRIPVKFKYDKAMGREREFTQEIVYTVAVKDLVDAKPLIHIADKPGLVNTCYTKVGKGMFIYSGFEDLVTIAEVLKVLGFAK